MADRARILSTWAEVMAEARRHLPGGQPIKVDLPGFYARTAHTCGVTVERVREVVEAAHG